MRPPLQLLLRVMTSEYVDRETKIVSVKYRMSVTAGDSGRFAVVVVNFAVLASDRFSVSRRSLARSLDWRRHRYTHPQIFLLLPNYQCDQIRRFIGLWATF